MLSLNKSIIRCANRSKFSYSNSPQKINPYAHLQIKEIRKESVIFYVSFDDEHELTKQHIRMIETTTTKRFIFRANCKELKCPNTS